VIVTQNKENNMSFTPGDPGDFNSLSEAAKEFIRKAGPTTEELLQLMTYEQFEHSLSMKFLEAQELLIKKHKDYGPKNISESPGGPLNGLRVRMHDKLARINHLYDSGATPENESLRDSFIDMANYSIIALMVLDGDWDNRTITAQPDIRENLDWA
jgi:ABC-type glycerol-3-phosphate transport system substrate-binding protein